MELKERLKDLEQRINKSTGEEWFYLGSQFISTRDYEGAKHCFERCVEKEPESYLTMANIGICYSEMNLKEEAIRYFNKAIELKPDYGNGWYNLGYTYESIGDIENMLKSYRKALSSKENLAFPIYNTIGYGLFVNCKDDHSEARRAIIQGIWLTKMEDESNNIKMELMNLGHIYLSQGRERLAMDKYQACLQEGGDIDIFKSIFSDDTNDLIQLGIPQNCINDVLTKIGKRDVNGPRILDKHEFIELVKSELIQQCKNITFRQEPDGIYLLNFGEVIMRWRFEHAFERYLKYKIEWELVAYGLAMDYISNVINIDNCIPQVIGFEAIDNYSTNKIAYRQLNEHLYIYFAEDREFDVKTLKESKYFKNGMIDWDRDYESSLNRLVQITLSNGFSISDELLWKKFNVDNYASALILVDSIWDNFPFHDSGKKIIIGIPNRDNLYFIDEGDKIISFQFETFIMNEYINSQHRLSPYLFIRENGKFERYETFQNMRKETKKWWQWWK